ncbi:MAG: VWA domain-containing protein [Candidatus Hydrogenedentes bacterium]|nr:VWA domain-containing protein [Candidatus Hydrogenedentota bacterium]
MPWNLTFDPAFPVPAIAGIGVALAVLVILAYKRAEGRAGWIRRSILATIRLAALAGLLLVLLRPMRTEPVQAQGAQPVFAIVTDGSASMRTPDVNNEPRYKAVANALTNSKEALLTGLASRYDVRFFTFAKEAREVSLDKLLDPEDPQGATTDLSEAVIQSTGSLASRPVAGMLLISDGRDNAGGDLEQAAVHLKGTRTPVWTVPVGSDTQTKDLFVTARLSQNFLFVQQPASLKVSLSQSGYAGHYAKVNLYREDEHVGAQQVMLKGNSVSVDFPVKEDAKGVFRYAVRVDPLPGEAVTANNSRTVFARVVDEKSRVLLVEAKPYWDSKFLLRALQKDPNLEVTSVFQLTPDKAFAIAEKPGSDPTTKAAVTQGVHLPASRDELYRYDCLIFGKEIDTLLSSEQLALLRTYLIERGGSIVFSRGRAYEQDNAVLSALEPVEWSDESLRHARIELTPEGLDSPLFAFGRPLAPDLILRELPDLVSITKVQSEKSLSVILARVAQQGEVGEELGAQIAAISYQRFGRGKVMSIGTAGLWRWAFMPPALSEYDDIYQRFWSQMIRWLIFESEFLPGQEISFRTSQYAYNLGERVLFSVRTQFVDQQDYRPEVTVKAPDGSSALLALSPDDEAPGTYSAYYQPGQEGEFEAVLHSAIGEPRPKSERFTVYADSIESRFVAANPETLQRISNITGGDTLTLERLSGLPQLVEAFERAARKEQKPTDAWDTMEVYSALIGLLALEWIARRRTGLV